MAVELKDLLINGTKPFWHPNSNVDDCIRTARAHMVVHMREEDFTRTARAGTFYASEPAFARERRRGGKRLIKRRLSFDVLSDKLARAFAEAFCARWASFRPSYPAAQLRHLGAG